MTKTGFEHRLKELYQPPRNRFTEVCVPKMKFMAINGQGDPAQQGFEEATQWLYAITHFIIPLAKERMGKRFAYPPLECLFWAEDEQDFMEGNKEKWFWRAMIVLADWMTSAQFENAVHEAEKKRGEQAPNTLGIEALHEQDCIQIMHVGDYGEIGPLCEKLYDDYLPSHNLVPHGPYHEIYLNDPKRTTPDKRKIVIRQPVRAG